MSITMRGLTPAQLQAAAQRVLERLGGDVRLVRNTVGNLAIHRRAGDEIRYVGFIGLMGREGDAESDPGGEDSVVLFEDWEEPWGQLERFAYTANMEHPPAE